ncbi:glycoside hydrolase family 3 C-terminal domain-containing protein [Streptomyces sp. Wh19]|uniref:Glycoside hydrolase family 3 C-terminal domain-containing protein n=2 Tax=Streptomyces sanglieri TaxID=193460 RepID=A0ABW2WJG1_9ACTN|nr:glycoside hydrolase family 3 C-terminal domain-containing protein [Streptomyces sp. Wh19]MDV9197984.1 glycoside hydrolase family 3 C-terminal domain-containing protein [Streptomyces sp. Wh19]
MTTHDPDSLSHAEQAALGSGADFWSTKQVGTIPSLTLTDGPHGVRRQVGADDHLGIAASEPATCFPPAVGLGQSWDAELVGKVGQALGAESRALDVDILLGPGVNIKRDPRCGRNFEYYSEDPHLTGVLATSWVSGLQGTGVGASLKHFAANNTEHDRMRSSSEVAPRPLREIYLRAFQRVVQQAQPWTVMCSYNRLNGTYTSQNHWLLTQVLRDEWGFDGVVVSDWGAVQDRVAAVAAGLDLEMPSTGGTTDTQVVEAAEAGTLDSAVLTRAAARMVALAAKAEAGRATQTPAFDPETHHALAREVAAHCVVLLKNDVVDTAPVLPLTAGRSLAVIGNFGQTPRYQGGGSSHVNPTRVDVPLDEIRALADGAEVTSAAGFTTDGTGTDAALRDEAIRAAGAADTAVVFLGLAAHQESEGFDRDHIELPAEQIELLEAVVRVQPRTVVVLSHGGVLCLAPVVACAPAILDGALLGQAGGGALADVLYGRVNPSARLTETVPVRIHDTPAYLDFPGEHSHVQYGEGLFVGYRWYDARDIPVTFPFGHGLSYTSFSYDGLELRSAADGITASVTVTNTGERAGREVAQFYVAKPGSSVARPPQELKGHAVVTLAPGDSERVTVLLDRQDLAYWDIRADRWVVEGGTYEVRAAASSRDIRATGTVEVTGDDLVLPLTLDSPLGEAMTAPGAAEILGSLMPMSQDTDEVLGIDMARMMASIPVSRLVSFSQGAVTLDDLEKLLAHLDAARAAADQA